MLSKPEVGWTRVSLGEFEASASYLTDIPFEWMKSFLHFFEENIPIALFLDEEGSDHMIVSYYEDTYVIRNNGRKSKLIRIWDMDSRRLAREFLKDIMENFEDWVKWNPFCEKENDLSDRRRELETLIERLQKKIENEW